MVIKYQPGRCNLLYVYDQPYLIKHNISFIIYTY